MFLESAAPPNLRRADLLPTGRLLHRTGRAEDEGGARPGAGAASEGGVRAVSERQVCY